MIELSHAAKRRRLGMFTRSLVAKPNSRNGFAYFDPAIEKHFD